MVTILGFQGQHCREHLTRSSLPASFITFMGSTPGRCMFRALDTYHQMVLATILRSIGISYLCQGSKYSSTVQQGHPWARTNDATQKEGPGVPCCVMPEINRPVPESWGKTGGPLGIVRLSGRFLLGGLEAAALTNRKLAMLWQTSHTHWGTAGEHQPELELSPDFFSPGWTNKLLQSFPTVSSFFKSVSLSTDFLTSPADCV